MTAEQFAYWMQGFAELTGDNPPTKAQWKSMKEHLQTVFVKVTPPVDTKPISKPIDLYKWPTQLPQHLGTFDPLKPLIAECCVSPSVSVTTC